MEKAKAEETKEKEALSEKEIEKIVLELSSQGLTSEKIGLILKSKHNAKAKPNKKISKILKENNIHQHTDHINLKKSIEQLDKHVSVHFHDYRTKRVLITKKARLNKLEKYLKLK